MYFALISYKRAEDCSLLIDEPKYLQAKVNQITKKGVKYSDNPFANDND